MARKVISDKLMILWSERKKMAEFWEKVMSGKNQASQKRREVKIDTLLLDNDEKNVIVNKVLSYF